MTELGLARRTGSILVVGHICLFIYGLLVAGLGRFFITDIAQMILMGAPVLAIVAFAGFSFIVRNSAVQDTSAKLHDQTAAKLVTFVVIVFLASLFFVYSLALFDTTSTSIDGIKISVGAIETALGGYIGIIKDKLFPSPEGG